jgi:hypothetical protein
VGSGRSCRAASSGLCGGVAFVTLYASAGAGVVPAEQGVASGIASSAKEIGGALGLAVFVALTTSSADLIDGLHLAGWTAAAVTVAGGLIALVLEPTRAPQQTPLEGAVK